MVFDFNYVNLSLYFRLTDLNDGINVIKMFFITQ